MLVPKLRFKRDDGTEYPEWKKTSFSKTCSGFEYGMNTSACDYDGINKYIRITDIDDTSRKYISEKVVSPNGNMQDKYIVKKNDILFARTGASVGKAYLYNENDGLLYYAGFLIRANVNIDNNAYFVFSQTMTTNYWNWVKLTSMRTGQQGINAQEYKAYKFLVPCLEEQQKIADFLSTVDEVIAQSKAEVQNLEQQKKAAMQKIFSQEVRFKREDGRDYPDWEEKQLKEVAKILMGQSPSGSSVNTDENGIPLIQGKSDILGYGIIPDRYTSTPTKVSESNDIIMTVRAPVGFVSKLGYVACIGRGVCAIRANENEDYIYYVLQNKESAWKYIEQGSTFTAVNSYDVSSLIVPVPCLEEQQKIADFLSAYDEAISYAKQELDKWKELKKGLLQQMFV